MKSSKNGASITILVRICRITDSFLQNLTKFKSIQTQPAPVLVSDISFQVKSQSYDHPWWTSLQKSH